jgi:hypothetical protein
MEDNEQLKSAPRLLRPVETPLALYLRPGRNDHKVSVQALAEGLRGIRGIIFNPTQIKVQQELRTEAVRTNLEAVLDTRTIELSSMPGELGPELLSLPWASFARQQLIELTPPVRREVAEKVANFVVGNGFTAVLAPTHFVGSWNDPWTSVDNSVAESLRNALDAAGGASIPIYYTLAAPSATFRDPRRRNEFDRQIRDLPVDSLWLRVHSFGTTASGPIALRGFIEAGQELHQLRIPLVAERTGTIGLALLAFGAVGGIESGITIGESFDIGRLRKPRTKGAFLPAARVYLRDLGAFLEVKKAREFFDLRNMKTSFACRESCWPRGIQDTLADPRRHFIITRTREVARLSSPPVSLRRQLYLEEFLRPATDRALQASRAFPILGNHRRRLESWRGTLGTIAKDSPLESWSQAPTGRRTQTRRASA